MGGHDVDPPNGVAAAAIDPVNPERNELALAARLASTADAVLWLRSLCLRGSASTTAQHTHTDAHKTPALTSRPLAHHAAKTLRPFFFFFSFFSPIS